SALIPRTLAPPLPGSAGSTPDRLTVTRRVTLDLRSRANRFSHPSQYGPGARSVAVLQKTTTCPLLLIISGASDELFPPAFPLVLMLTKRVVPAIRSR